MAFVLERVKRFSMPQSMCLCVSIIPMISVLFACPFFQSDSICYHLLINVDMNNKMNGLVHVCVHVCILERLHAHDSVCVCVCVWACT